MSKNVRNFFLLTIYVKIIPTDKKIAVLTTMQKRIEEAKKILLNVGKC